MAIIKTKIKENPYLQIDKTGIDDENISFRATGLLAYLIGRPSNWNIRLEHLANVKKEKRDAIKATLLELREHNYCHYFEIRNKGKIKETLYFVYEIPTPYSEELHNEILENLDEMELEDILYYKIPKENKKPKTENPLSDKNILKSEVEPKTEKPLTDLPLAVNHTLIIKDINNNRMNKINNHDHDFDDDLNEIKDFFNKIGIDFSEKHKEKIIELLKKNSKDYLLSFFKRQYEILSKKENVKSIAAIMSNHLFNNTCETDRDFIEKKEKNIQKNSKKIERNEERILKNTEEMEKFNEESNLIIEKLQTLNKEKQEEILNEAEKRRIEKVPMTAATLPLLRNEKQVYCRILMKDIKEILLEKRLL